MKIKKLGVYFVVAMLMVSFALSSVSINIYAETPKKIGIGNLTEDDLVSAWYFDEDSGDVVKDYKGNYDGTANGTTIVDTPYGKGRDFDGESYIQFNNPVVPTGKKSIRFKLKSTVTDNYQIIFSNGSISAEPNGISMRTQNGILGIFGYKGTQSESNFRLEYPVNICDGNYHDILFTWDGTTNKDAVKLFIDDMNIPKLTTTALSTEPSGNQSSDNLFIGRRTTDSINIFKGILTQIEVYNEAYIPPVPKNLTAKAGDEKVDLSWDEVDNADSYTIKRSKTEGEPYETIAEDITETSYTDKDVENGTTYYYVVSAVIDGNETENSNEASATPEAPELNNALLKVTMINGKINEYDLSTTEVNDFINWYEDRGGDIGKPYYTIEKDYNIGPFTSRKDYLAFDKILQFEVMEYNK